MADAKPLSIPGNSKSDVLRLTGLKKRQQIELAGRNMFIWVVVAAIAVSFCLATGQYLFSKWQYNNKIIGAKYKAGDTLAQNITNAKELKAEIDSLVANTDLASVRTDPNDSNLKSILDALPTVSDPAALATSLQQAILSRSGVTVENITVPPESEDSTDASAPSTPQELKIGFVVSGSYQKMQALVHDLERTIRPIKVTTIILNGSDADLRVNFEAVTYYQPAKTVNAREEVVK